MEDKKDMIVLLQKLYNIQKEVEYLRKDMSVGGQYKGMSDEKVKKAFSKSFDKHRVVCLPVDMDKQIDIFNFVQKGYNKKSVTTSVDMKYNLYCVDTGAYLSFVSSGTGVDSQDKGIGKALTYAYKNGLLNSFCVATGDDTDKVHSDDIESLKPFLSSHAKTLKQDLEAGKPIDGLNVWLEQFAITEDQKKKIQNLNNRLLK